MKMDGSHVFFDFDSTIVTKESLDEVIAHALATSPNKTELVEKVEEITNLGMEGKLAFTESLERRFAVIPLSRTHFEYVGHMLLEHVTLGMEELFAELREKNISTYIISGGFFDSILPVATKLGVEKNSIFTNQIVTDADGNVAGIDTTSVCYTNDGKAPVIAHIKKTHALIGPTCMIGDGANDLKAYELGVADHFCAFTGNVERAIMQEKAPAVASTVEELRDFIFSAYTDTL